MSEDELLRQLTKMKRKCFKQRERLHELEVFMSKHHKPLESLRKAEAQIAKLQAKLEEEKELHKATQLELWSLT